MLNIPSTVVDTNYRYKMPKMQTKIESKGNGIKTNIVNLPDVAKHLRTNELYILKFFGFEKASQVIEKASQAKVKQQGKSATSYIIQGQFTQQELLKVLDKFIDKYILCPKCKLPEMHMFIEKQRIKGKCDSCPFNGEIDNKHKLSAFIMKNPPQYKPQAAKRNQQKITKIQQPLTKTEGQNQKDELTKEENVEQQKKEQEKATDLFSAESIEFGGQQLEQLIKFVKNKVEQRKKQDFDIACAQIVSDLKPLGLKKPYYAYILFNTFFGVSIHKQVQEWGPMYIHLMKKLASRDGKNASTKQQANKIKSQSIEIETMLNLEYLYLQVNKDKDYSKIISTVLMKLLENQLFSQDFVKAWSKGEIKDLEKMFMYNQERDDKFKQLAVDFIDYINDDGDDDEAEGDD